MICVRLLQPALTAGPIRATPSAEQRAGRLSMGEEIRLTLLLHVEAFQLSRDRLCKVRLHPLQVHPWPPRGSLDGQTLLGRPLRRPAVTTAGASNMEGSQRREAIAVAQKGEEV